MNTSLNKKLAVWIMLASLLATAGVSYTVERIDLWQRRDFAKHLVANGIFDASTADAYLQKHGYDSNLDDATMLPRLGVEGIARQVLDYPGRRVWIVTLVVPLTAAIAMSVLILSQRSPT